MSPTPPSPPHPPAATPPPPTGPLPTTPPAPPSQVWTAHTATAHTATAHTATAHAATGPVAAHTATAHAATGPVGGTASARLLARVGAAALTVAALAIGTDGQPSWYESSTVWAVFATVAAAAQVAPSLATTPSASRPAWTPLRRWQVAAAGTGGLATWWALVALPGVASDQGFVATAAVATTTLATWLDPDRPR